MDYLTILVIFSFSVGIAIIIFIGSKLTRRISQLAYQNRLLKALRSLDVIATSTTEVKSLSQGVVDVVHKELGYFFGIVVLLDNRGLVVRRVAITKRPEIEAIIKKLSLRYEDQTIPLSDSENLLVRAIKEHKNFYTPYLFNIQKGLFPENISSEIQKNLGLKAIFVYPLVSKDKVFGAISYGSTTKKEKFSQFEYTIMEEFALEVSRVLENIMLYEDLKFISKQLEKANLKLMELDQLKDDFVSVTSHELRTPMAAIKSYAWMALHRSGVKLPDNLERYLIRVLLSAERLINLVNDLLNISRIEGGRIEINPESIDMISLIKDIVDEVYYSKSREKSIQIIILEQSLPKVFADPEKLRQVFLNIMGNAVKFSPRDGKIKVGFFTDGITVETYIQDQGPGISKDDMGRLFQKFGRLDSSYVATATSGGTGLGLYISKSLVELMHGRIWASSDGLGKGATFSISLPVATQVVLQDIEKYRVIAKGEAKGLEPIAI